MSNLLNIIAKSKQKCYIIGDININLAYKRNNLNDEFTELMFEKPFILQ